MTSQHVERVERGGQYFSSTDSFDDCSFFFERDPRRGKDCVSGRHFRKHVVDDCSEFSQDRASALFFFSRLDDCLRIDLGQLEGPW